MSSPQGSLHSASDNANEDIVASNDYAHSDVEELDPHETFGHLYEGLSFRASHGEEALSDHRRAYQMRRDLAELTRVPEGYEYTFFDVRGNSHSFVVLSPPDLIAIQRDDGVWVRETRYESPSEPSPYSEDWYAEYLTVSGLPSWFMRPGHQLMINDDAESRALGLNNAPSTSITPRSDYLEHRYPAEVAYPEPLANESYVLSGLVERQEHLARAFPAINVEGVQSSIVVLPSGHIQLRSEGVINMPSMDELDIEWFETEGVDYRASYRVGVTSSSPQAPTRLSRSGRVQLARDNGGLVNPVSTIMGIGTLEWLDPTVDEPLAREMGYSNPDEVSTARQQGALAAGIGANAGPFVVFWPAAEYLNPAVQPDGEGAWRFLSVGTEDSDDRMAAINFGGNNGLPAYPTAAQIYRLRQWFYEREMNDITREINIVWAPGADLEDDTWSIPDDAFRQDHDDYAASAEDDAAIRHPTATEARALASGGAGITMTSSPTATTSPATAAPPAAHDPTNGQPGGELDQTGGPKAMYDTAVDRGQRITIDRSRCHIGDVEPWKLWCYGSRGWKKWNHAATMDWTDAKKIGMLNKHREQTHQRARIWGPLRQQAREDYTSEQREWLMEQVNAARGERPLMPVRDLTAQFNQRFRTSRAETGILSLVDRLRKEYAEGGLRERMGRGWPQQQRSQQSRATGSGGSKRKRSASPVEEGDDEESAQEGEVGDDDAEDGDYVE